MTDLSPEIAALKRWHDEPHTFVRQCLGAEPDPWQDKALRDLVSQDRMAISGSKGSAKTAFFAFAIWYTLVTQPNCKIAATSINGTQLRDGLWSELALWQSKSKLLQTLFHWSPQRIVRKTSPATWFASARTWNQTADPHTQAQALAGFRGDRVMFVIDEAGGVPGALLATADAVLASKQPGHFAKVLIGGNTTSQIGALYLAVAKQRNLWHCIRVTSDPNDPDRTARVSKEWAQQQIDAYGRQNPWVKINVFAEFPEQAAGKLISLQDMEAAEHRKVDPHEREAVVLGVDVGTINDACVIYPRKGRRLMPARVMRGKDSIVIAGEIVKVARELGATTVFVDAGGPGIGVIDALRAMGQSSVVPVFFGGGADDSTRYLNKRIEMYVRAAAWVKEGGQIEGREPELVQDMCEPETTWKLTGEQVLEDKDEIKKRLGRSPDWGDGFALTFAYPVAALSIEQAMRTAGIVPAAHDEFGFGPL